MISIRWTGDDAGLDKRAPTQSVQRRILARLLPHCAVLIAFTLGCASSFVTVVPPLPDDYERVGPATGKACGTLFFYSSAYGFIPVMLNSRVERAYREAVASAPGSTALTDVTMQENWYWWVLGMTRCTTIRGEAIR